MSKFEFIAGGGKSVKVDQAEHGMVMVSGTPMITHDLPIGETWRAGDANDPDVIGAEREARIAAGITSWCHYSDHEGERELPVASFDLDGTRENGRHPYCKDCRSLIRCRAYAAAQEAQGKTVRAYKRRDRNTKASN